MRIFAGPFVGEFGWELFCWQGHLRYLADQYDEVIVAGNPDHHLLYEDFCTDYIPLKINGPKNGPFNFCYSYDNLHEKYNTDKVIPPGTQLCRYRIECRQEYFNLKQKFIKYGNPDKKYDILIHARNVAKNKYNDTSYRNWPLNKWQVFVDNFKFLNIASIGTIEESHHVKGTEDLRGIPLSDLANYMAGSKACVGVSSGPMHFASLCGCLQVVWWGEVIGENNQSLLNDYRHKQDWNPFQSKVAVVSSSTFNIDEKELIQVMEANLNQ